MSEGKPGEAIPVDQLDPFLRAPPESAAEIAAESEKAAQDLMLYGVGFCVNGWHVPAQTVGAMGGQPELRAALEGKP